MCINITNKIFDIVEMSESTAGAGSSSRSKDEDKKLKLLPKNAKSMSTSAKRMQKELGEITLDPPPNCRYIDICHVAVA